jgi:hypothetical protein
VISRLHIFSFCVLAIAGCNNATVPDSSYQQEVLSARLQKDAVFFDAEQTVLRPKELAKFTGLRYFPVNESFRFVSAFERIEDPPTVLISKQASGPVPYHHIGQVVFNYAGQEYRLSVFRNLEMDDKRAWIPFHDATNNGETYGGGRYLDIDIPEADTVVVDFNLAYNPYCVYNAYDFNCAIPPAENRLPFGVEAGEKNPLLLEN